MSTKNIRRRKFISDLTKTGIGLSTFSTLGGLNLLKGATLFNSSIYEPSADYKVLVCLFLGGGNDSYNMLVPMGKDYSTYETTRTNLALSEDQLLEIKPTNTPGKRFGLHPRLDELQALFNNGNAAFISNIGTLINPVTPQEIEDDTAELPLGLFSHLDQAIEWMTASPHKRILKGWGGKIADRMTAQNPPNNIPMNFSLSGTNTFQQGLSTIEFAINPYSTSYGFRNYGEREYSTYWTDYTHAIDSLLEHPYKDPFKQTYANVLRDSRDAYLTFGDAMENTEDITTEFRTTRLSQSFKRIAKVIKANQILGFKRQIFFVDYGGFDNHDELLDNHNTLLREVNDAVGAFYRALEEINAAQNTVLFSMSEFARTLTSNGNGTDHAWGGHSFVVGGNVNGKKIYGEYPSLDLNNDEFIYRETVVPTHSTDEYFAELAKWFGVGNSDINDIFPNLKNFHNINSGLPFGFINV